MSEKIVMRVGEALVAGGPLNTAAEPEVAIGEMDGPMGVAFANQMANQSQGHSKVLAIMDTDIQVRPATLMVSKVTVKSTAYTNILMGTVQGAIANGVLDAVREGIIPLFEIHRKATTLAIKKAMNSEPSIDWLLENQEKTIHKYYQRALDAKK